MKATSQTMMLACLQIMVPGEATFYRTSGKQDGFGRQEPGGAKNGIRLGKCQSVRGNDEA